MGRLAGVGMMMFACALGCRSGISPAEREAYERAIIDDSRSHGARARAALPACGDAPVPEGAIRIEGNLAQGHEQRICTDALCPETRPCCNTCGKELTIVLDDRRHESVPIQHSTRLLELFGGHDAPSCAVKEWWKGMGTPRVRMTLYPNQNRQGRRVDLCRVEDRR